MILLDEAHAKTRTTYSQEPVSPRGGKRPRTTSSISAPAPAVSAAAAAAADSVNPTEAALLKQDKSGQHQTPLFRLRRHLHSKVQDAAPSSRANTLTRRTSLASTNAAPAAARVSLNSVDTRDDTAGEAEAMVADEERSSPPTSPHHSQGGNYSRERPTATLAGEADSKKVGHSIEMFTAQVDGAAAYHGLVDCGGNPPSAPAYGPPPYGEDPSSPSFARAKGTRQDGEEDRLEGTHQDDASSPRAGVALPKADQESRAREANHARQESAPLLALISEGPPRSRGASRENFLSSMSVSDDACKRVREDLSRYMEGVRKRCVRDVPPVNTKHSESHVSKLGWPVYPRRSFTHPTLESRHDTRPYYFCPLKRVVVVPTVGRSRSSSLCQPTPTPR